jgi:hypothetical protein
LELTMLIFKLYCAGVLLVVLGVVAYYLLTRGSTGPAHSSRRLTVLERARGLVRRKPRSRRQQARRDAKRAEWGARLTRARGLLTGLPRPRDTAPVPLIADEPAPVPDAIPAPAPDPVPAVVPAEPAGDTPAADLTESPSDENWAAELAQQVRDEARPGPNDHLRRVWEHQTDVWKQEELAKMLAAGQMPPVAAEPPSLDRTETWLAITEETGQQDAFMGREPVQKPEEGTGKS